VGQVGGAIAIGNAAQSAVDYVEGRITGEELAQQGRDAATAGLHGKLNDMAEAQNVLQKAGEDAEFVRRNEAERVLSEAGVPRDEISAIRDAMVGGDDAPLNEKISELNQGRAPGEQLSVSDRTDLGRVEADENYGDPLGRVPGELKDAGERAVGFVGGTVERLDQMEFDARESVSTQNQANQTESGLAGQDAQLRGLVDEARPQFPADWTDEMIANWLIANRDLGTPGERPVMAEDSAPPKDPEPPIINPPPGGGGEDEGRDGDGEEPFINPDGYELTPNGEQEPPNRDEQVLDFILNLVDDPWANEDGEPTTPPGGDGSSNDGSQGAGGTIDQLLMNELERPGSGNLSGIYSDRPATDSAGGSAGDFADPTVGGNTPTGTAPGNRPVDVSGYRPPGSAGAQSEVDENAFNRGMNRWDSLANFRIDGDYPQASRLKKALDEYRRALAEFRRMQAERRRAQEIAEYQRRLNEYYRQVAWQQQQYNNWLAAQQQAAQPHYQPAQPSGGHHQGGLINDN
jgi:hypothetical protein